MICVAEDVLQQFEPLMSHVFIDPVYGEAGMRNYIITLCNIFVYNIQADIPPGPADIDNSMVVFIYGKHFAGKPYAHDILLLWCVNIHFNQLQLLSAPHHYDFRGSALWTFGGK